MISSLDLVKLTSVMELTTGSSKLTVGLIDGPIVMNHPDLMSGNIHQVPGKSGICTKASSIACIHGTFVAGILSAKRNSVAPAICPNCTLLVHPIFVEAIQEGAHMPSATPDELASAIIECINNGAKVLNLSVALAHLSSKGERMLEEALNYAAKRGVIIVAASGNQGTVGSTCIIRHPWVIPVAACDINGRPLGLSNFGGSIGKRGLCAPGENITSLGADEKPLTLGGTSVATPFVTGAIALMWSLFPNVTAVEIKLALTQANALRRTTVVPPLLDAWAAYQMLMRAR